MNCAIVRVVAERVLQGFCIVYFRKNPKHFNDESHPGDDSYGEESEESASDSDDKPECEFGTDCKRWVHSRHVIQYEQM